MGVYIGDSVGGSDGRSSDRVAFRCKIRYGKGRLEYMALVTDISGTGLCIKTSEVYAKGEKLVMELESSGKLYRAEGVVMWAKVAPPGLSGVVKCGMGVSFTKQDEALAELYQRKKL
ncbi:MAG: PilZ domain-containing protein [Deltaproteobacteria bacterium]|nr:PilZ domain-containing protein [Deltaproteobacteria bacterium]